MALIIVTGANGFIGSNLLERLLLSDLETFGLAPRRYANRFAGGATGDELSFWAVDLTESLVSPNFRRFSQSSRVTFVSHKELVEKMDALPEAPLAVIHNGACSSTTETDPEVFANLNVNYSIALWEACAKRNIPFIYASSASVYGDGTLGFSDEKELTQSYKPLNLYGKSKHDFDLWALSAAQKPPTWFGLRYFNVYGPFEAHKGGQASMVFHGYRQATRTGVIRLFESNVPEYEAGNQVRDFVYVKDVLNVTLAVLQICLQRQRGTGIEIKDQGMFLNVGRGVTETWNSLATAVFKALGMPPRIEYIEMPESLSKHYQNYTCAQTQNLRSLGIASETFSTLEDGVHEYVQKFLMRGL